MNLESSKKAIANWKKLKTLLLMLKFVGGNLTYKHDHPELDEDEKKDQKWNEKLAFYTILPKNRYKMAWDLMAGMIYLACYFIDPYVITFEFEPLEVHEKLNHLQIIFSFILIIDMVLVPLSATPKK